MNWQHLKTGGLLHTNEDSWSLFAGLGIPGFTFPHAGEWFSPKWTPHSPVPGPDPAPEPVINLWFLHLTIRVPNSPRQTFSRAPKAQADGTPLAGSRCFLTPTSMLPWALLSVQPRRARLGTPSPDTTSLCHPRGGFPSRFSDFPRPHLYHSDALLPSAITPFIVTGYLGSGS